MKKISIVVVMLVCFYNSQAGTTVISVKGKGGLDSDGTTHKICQVKDVAECASIVIKDKAFSIALNVENVEAILTEGENSYNIVIVRAALEEGNASVQGSNLIFTIKE